MPGELTSVAAKLRSKGLRFALKAAGRRTHAALFRPDWDFELVPRILENVLAQQDCVQIVQVGANVGKTESDQIYDFLKKYFYRPSADQAKRCRAVLVEPVRHLYRQLVENYADFQGVICENVAIAEVRGTKKFYRLREGINPLEHGLDRWAEQLGSFLPDKLSTLWLTSKDPEAARKFVTANTVIDEIQCVTLADLIEKHRLTSIDLLQIDTEGYDYQILRTIDFGRIRPRYINYERIHLGKDEARCRDLMLDHGYKLQDHGQDTLCMLEPLAGRVERARARLYNRWLDLIH